MSIMQLLPSLLASKKPALSLYVHHATCPKDLSLECKLWQLLAVPTMVSDLSLSPECLVHVGCCLSVVIIQLQAIDHTYVVIWSQLHVQ